jgi:membrane protease YdiL (CAAX protease family)
LAAWLIGPKTDIAKSGFLVHLIWAVLICAFDRSVFSPAYWHVRFRHTEWAWVVLLAVFQLIVMATSSTPQPTLYYAISALALAPVVEELARAVMIVPLTERLGPLWGTVITSLLWALAHDLFWLALAQQIILCLIFLRTRRSLPVAILAHFLMNLIAVAYPFAAARF